MTVKVKENDNYSIIVAAMGSEEISKRRKPFSYGLDNPS